jgi:predicted metal-binding protein
MVNNEGQQMTTFFCGGCLKHKPMAMFGEKNTAGRNRCTTCVERIKLASAKIHKAPKCRRVNPDRLSKHLTTAMQIREEMIAAFV